MKRSKYSDRIVKMMFGIPMLIIISYLESVLNQVLFSGWISLMKL